MSASSFFKLQRIREAIAEKRAKGSYLWGLLVKEEDKYYHSLGSLAEVEYIEETDEVVVRSNNGIKFQAPLSKVKLVEKYGSYDLHIGEWRRVSSKEFFKIQQLRDIARSETVKNGVLGGAEGEVRNWIGCLVDVTRHRKGYVSLTCRVRQFKETGFIGVKKVVMSYTFRVYCQLKEIEIHEYADRVDICVYRRVNAIVERIKRAYRKLDDGELSVNYSCGGIKVVELDDG